MLFWASAIIIFQICTLAAVCIIAIKLKQRFYDFDRKYENLETLSKKSIANQEKAIRLTKDKASEIQNTCGIYLIGFRFPVFFGDWAIDSHLGKFIIDYIIENNPTSILEIGSGTSTILISKLMHTLKYPHTHIVVDHEKKYLEKTKNILKLNGITDLQTKFLHLPLERIPVLGNEYLYYSNIEKKVGDEKFDFVIIDGPPGSTGNNARFPALPLLHNKLSHKATIILDDYCREQEKEIVSKWLTLFPEFSLNVIKKGHQCAILTKEKF